MGVSFYPLAKREKEEQEAERGLPSAHTMEKKPEGRERQRNNLLLQRLFCSPHDTTDLFVLALLADQEDARVTLSGIYTAQVGHCASGSSSSCWA